MSKKKNGPRTPRDRELQKRVRERQERTGESYQLAWRRLTEAEQRQPANESHVENLNEGGGLPTIEEVLARDRKQRAAPPFMRPEYAQDVDPHEAEFGFARRIVLTPRRMGHEPDRMHAVVAEMSGILGHLFAVKLAAGGYEIRTTDMSNPIDTVSSFEQLVARYVSQRRIPFDSFALPTGIDYSGTIMPQARLARLILDRFRTSEFPDAVRAAEPERKLLHFGGPRFEIIHPSGRYARFSIEYMEMWKHDKTVADGMIRGEVEIGVIVGDDQAIADGLRLVDVCILDPRGVERDMTLGSRVKGERRWEQSPDSPPLEPMEIRLGDGPFSLQELTATHRRLPPAHSLLVRKTDYEYGDYHEPVVVYEMQILAKIGDGYRTLTTREIESMYPDPVFNAEEFGP